MTEDTYAVELTFREWMDICHAIGFIQSYYKLREMDGQANKFDAIQSDIAEGLKND